MKIDELLTPPDNNPDHEAAFRRGYHHGAYNIIQALKNGHSIDKIEKFIDTKLKDWRHDFTNPAFPPDPNTKTGI
ncbi:hypothetical protein O4H49_20105 [Kiloniella laminariae]|uniref:Uncharacterized protein n=1 Tax=Kiloniella laminariae TaxID=454162 RepID=A0ABT4LPP0_9PROT|nr:hypothetical protein [Kiloniella laminariae]MCZ4283099.1 hypothetical protein [Kiloniella laminariae]